MRINSDMVPYPDILKNVSIAEFYGHKNILITGATGFMGKVLLETLLRKCPDINCVYILVRMKRGVDPKQRYHDFIDDIVFDKLRNESPSQLEKIKLIKGDMLIDNLDIDEKDMIELVENVDIVFHCAAKAKFSLTLRDALSHNLHATWRVLQLAEKLKNLIVFSHFSTVYCNPLQKVCEEKYQKPSEDPFKVIKALMSDREQDLEDLYPVLMHGQPNTYAVSKLLTEELVHLYRDRIRFVVTRPAVIISAWREPFIGYVDNKKNGLIGPMMARASGALRTILSNPNKLVELVPVDVATHAIIVLTCKRALMEGNEILYCNIIDAYTQPWTFKQYFDLEMATFKKYPMRNQLWWPYCVVTGSRFYYNFRRLFHHYVPAAIGDVCTFIFRRKPQLIFFQRKFDRGMHTMSYYNTKEYFYKNEQFMSLPNEMNDKDREIFYCDFKRFKMEEVLKNYVLGVRKFILGINDTDSLELRRGILTLFWHVDLLTRVVLGIVYAVVIFFVLFFIIDSDLLFDFLRNVFNTVCFLASNYFILSRDVIDKCNQS